MPPFSRLQLAAALIEYDNDPDDPDGPYRCAEESAIFLFLKGRPQPRKTLMGYDEMPRRSVDFLGVPMPSEEQPNLVQRSQPMSSNAALGTRGSMEMLAGGRKTPEGRRSVELLARPSSELAKLNGSLFRGGDGEDSEEEGDETLIAGPELNLASWGIDDLLVKEQPKPRSRASSVNLYNIIGTPGEEPPRPRADSRASSNALHTGGNRRSLGARAKSMGDWGIGKEETEPWEAARIGARPRPSSMADPEEIAERNQHPPVAYRRRADSVSMMSMQQPVDFPRSATSGADAPAPNPFEIPVPLEGNGSRFDPKTIAHQRNISLASMTLSTRGAITKTQTDDGNEAFSSMANIKPDWPEEQSNRFSKVDLLRPKVLIMPAPLQDAVEEEPAPQKPVRDGYLDSTDARPLPPGAKTARMSTYGNGFGVNPRSSMTLSQLTFRNSLMVGGQRDPSYVDLESHLRRAEKEGEIIEQEVFLEPEVEEAVPHRAAGKLYGRSLIDDLEARKAQLKSKARVFRGDERPSMMQRAQLQRSSTLIDAEDLQQNARGIVPRPELHRNPSSGGEPLLNFGADPVPGTNVQLRPQMGRAGTSIPNSRSVFGVDQVWEKELAKLKQIEALEKAEEEERMRQELKEKAKEEARAAKKAAKKAKGKNKSSQQLDSEQYAGPGDVSPIARTSQAPPLLPVVDPFAMPPVVKDSSSDSDSDDENQAFARTQSRMQTSKSQQQDWLSDDERQVVAARPRPQPRQQPSSSVRNLSSFAAGLHISKEDSDDSDVPLTSALAKAKQRQQAEDSEEDKPLAAVLSNSIATLDFGGTLLADVKKPVEKPMTRSHPPAIRRAGKSDSDSEDDKPLALRSPSKFRQGGGESDDEKPLGMRYSMAPSQIFSQQQHQQHQQQAMMQQQMMQQQMMAAAQMRSSMFNPMMMGNMNMNMGFPNSMGMSAMNTGMMSMPVPPMGMMEPAGSVDPARLSAVDRWRRGVGGAAEG